MTRSVSPVSPFPEDATTEDAINALGDDVTRALKAVTEVIDAGERQPDGTYQADYGFTARQLVRAIFAYIEAVTFTVKVSAAMHCMENDVELSDPERFFAADLDHYLDDQGRV